MPVFEYKGLDGHGKSLSGIIDADSPRMARQRLKETGVYATEVVLGSAKSKSGSPTISIGGRRIKPMEVALLTRQLATLVSAGLPMLECLSALLDQVESTRLRNVLAQVREKVKEGEPLSDALMEHPKIFGQLYVSMVRAGEASGTLGPMLVRLSDFSERQVALQGTVVATMTYPVLMIVLGLLILGLLMTFVVPKVTGVFEGMNAALPTPTVVLIAISDAVRAYWWLLIGAAGGAWYWVQRWRASDDGALRYDRIILSLPVMGKLVRMVAVSRFTRTLSTLLAGGIPLLEAMSITRQVVLNRVLADAIGNASENIKEGESIAQPLAASGVFPPMVTHMIAVGEATGELEAMLVKVAEAYDREVETTIGSLTSILSPIMILVMGGAVFAIVMAILLPIVELSGVVG